MSGGQKRGGTEEEKSGLLGGSASAARTPQVSRRSKDPEALTSRRRGVNPAAVMATLGVAVLAAVGIAAYLSVQGSRTKVRGSDDDAAVELDAHELMHVEWCSKIPWSEFPVDKCKDDCILHMNGEYLGCSKFPDMHNPPVPLYYKKGCLKFEHSYIVCQNNAHARLRSNFRFWANDHRVYQIVLKDASAVYNADDRTYTFPQCKNHECFQPYCIGRCGAGCGNEKYTRECRLLEFQEIGAFSGSVNSENQLKCRHHCLNHDLCSFAHLCPDNVEYIGPAKPSTVGCNKGPFFFAARDYVSKIGQEQDCKDFAADGIVDKTGDKEGYKVYYPSA